MIRKNDEGINEIAIINIFESINGEGYAAGKPTVFIRTFGCNIRCAYCDTKECWSEKNLLKVYPERVNWKQPFMWLTASQIFNQVQSIEENYKHKSICLTGGEPLMEENKNFMIQELLPKFVDAGYDVAIETNGAIDYTDYKMAFGDSKIVDSFGSRQGITIVADYKLPCSGMTQKMVQENFKIYSDMDIVKMVISDNPRDWQELDRIVNEIETKASIYLSPCFGEVTLTKIPNYVIKHCDKNIKAQIQLHKIFWSPMEKDV